ARCPPQQPADAADLVRRQGAGAGRGGRAARRQPDRHDDGPGRDRQDAAVTAGRRERGRRLHGRHLPRRVGDGLGARGRPLAPSQLTALERASLPEASRRVDVATLATYEAVRLFIARATAVRPGFLVTNENAPAVAAICARLHGMPLAIELAAARIKLLSPEAILSRLEHQLNVLAAGARDLPERQQTLRGASAWSHDALAD